MKRLIAALISVMLVFTSAAAADIKGSSDSVSEVTANFDNIEEIMLKYSPEMLKVKNDLDSAKGSYFDIVDDMDDIQDKIKATDNFTLSASLTQQYDNLEDTRDKLKCAMDMAEAQYEQKVKQQVLKAQQQYLTYFIDASQKSYSDEALVKKQKDVVSAKEKLEKGYISKNAYDALYTSYLEMQNKLSVDNDKTTADYRGFKIVMGIPQSVNMTLETPDMGKTDFDALLKLDFEKDLNDMLLNSAEIKAKQISYSSKLYGDYAKSWEIDAAKIALNQAKDTLSENLKKQYDNLKNSWDSLKNSRIRLSEKQRDMENEVKKLSKGLSSDTKVYDTKLQLKSLENEVNTKEMRLYYDYITYLQTVKGF